MSASVRADFDVILVTDEFVLLRDNGPWDVRPTITNDAEAVVSALVDAQILRDWHRLFYFDSEHELTEIKVKNGVHAGFQQSPDRLLVPTVTVSALDAFLIRDQHSAVLPMGYDTIYQCDIALHASDAETTEDAVGRVWRWLSRNAFLHYRMPGYLADYLNNHVRGRVVSVARVAAVVDSGPGWPYRMHGPVGERDLEMGVLRGCGDEGMLLWHMNSPRVVICDHEYESDVRGFWQWNALSAERISAIIPSPIQRA